MASVWHSHGNIEYLYAVLESEARTAAGAALGLDPGLGFIHNDAAARDSLACDLMEPVRPEIDAWVLDWITRDPLKREWFFEQRDGKCRLMGSFATRLAETAPMWARAVAPIAEWVARQLWTRRRDSRETGPATRLTQSRKREAKGIAWPRETKPVAQPYSVCQTCGKAIKTGRKFCSACAVPVATERILEVAEAGHTAGRAASQTTEAQARRASTQQRHALAKSAWVPSSQPAWLTVETYQRQILPRLTAFSNSTIASALSISKPYASAIRAGKRRAHPRHWQALARLVRIVG